MGTILFHVLMCNRLQKNTINMHVLKYLSINTLNLEQSSYYFTDGIFDCMFFL